MKNIPLTGFFIFLFGSFLTAQSTGSIPMESTTETVVVQVKVCYQTHDYVIVSKSGKFTNQLLRYNDGRFWIKAGGITTSWYWAPGQSDDGADRAFMEAMASLNPSDVIADLKQLHVAFRRPVSPEVPNPEVVLERILKDRPGWVLHEQLPRKYCAPPQKKRVVVHSKKKTGKTKKKKGGKKR